MCYNYRILCILGTCISHARCELCSELFISSIELSNEPYMKLLGAVVAEIWTSCKFRFCHMLAEPDTGCSIKAQAHLTGPARRLCENLVSMGLLGQPIYLVSRQRKGGIKRRITRGYGFRIYQHFPLSQACDFIFISQLFLRVI